MNRKEWYEHYSAARILSRARFPRTMPIIDDKNRGQQLVWDITYEIIKEMGYGIQQAVFASTDTIYPIKDNRWAIKHNIIAYAIERKIKRELNNE